MAERNKYIAPDGKLYELFGIPQEILPEFGQDDNGNLIYRYETDQTLYSLTINSNIHKFAVTIYC